MKQAPLLISFCVLFLVAGGLVFARQQPGDPLREGPRPLKPAAYGVGRLLPDLSVTDIDGETRRLSDFREQRALVIALTSTSCPVSRRYTPSLARLEREYAERGVAFLFVNTVAVDPPEEIRAAIREHRLQGPYVHDEEGELARALGALTTTDTFVLDAARTLVYRGAVDDQYGLGYSLEAPRTRYLADALEAALAGRAPAAAATWAPGCVLETGGEPETVPALTYHNRISRLVQDNCLECHRPGGVGPFSLESYEDVTTRAGMIRYVVERGTMPPWYAAPTPDGEDSPWLNDRSLSPRDKADLLAWLAGDRPAGDPADAPLPRQFPGEWEIGEPDAVVELPLPISIPAEGIMPYQHVLVPLNNREDRWVQAVEVQPTAREVVHHVLVFLVPPFAPQPGQRPGQALRERLRGVVDETRGFFAAYVPGGGSLIYPDGFAKPVPAGSSLLFQLHYTPNGTATEDRTRLGISFAEEAPRHGVEVTGIANTRLRIPPGAENHRETAEHRFESDARLLALMPHMHVRGKAFRYDLILPDGEERRLLDVPRWDFNWQMAYRFAEPVAAPRGSRLRITGWFDNSANNPANPDPAATVRWGLQTHDEMLLGYVEYYDPAKAPGED